MKKGHINELGKDKAMIRKQICKMIRNEQYTLDKQKLAVNQKQMSYLVNYIALCIAQVNLHLCHQVPFFFVLAVPVYTSHKPGTSSAYLST
jgi:hypothetical protein